MRIPERSHTFVALLGAMIVGSAVSALGQNYGDSCAEEGPFCDESIKLKCQNATCACEYVWQIYDAEQRKCMSPVGGFCNLDGSLPCVRNAVCSTKNQFLGFCLCDSPNLTVAASSCEGSSRPATAAGNAATSSGSALICCPGATINIPNQL